MESERRLATGGAAEYGDTLAPDAVVVVPGAVLNRDACIQAMGASPGWDDARLEDAAIIDSGDVSSVVYTFHGRRGDDMYNATLASTYRREGDGWKLVLHQQTPH